MRSLRLLMVLSLAALMGLAALASWYDRRAALRAAEDHVALTVNVMREQALNVFQTQELVLDQIRQRTAGLDWDAISRSAELAQFLRKTRDRMDGISSIWLADAAGHVRAAAGGLYPPALTFANRDDFRAQQIGDAGTLVGRPRHLRPQ